MTYNRRLVDDRLDHLAGLPAVALEGMRAVGKTSTAQQRAAHTIRLDDPEAIQRVRADLRQLEPGPGPVLIDEWQRVPASWDYVRRAVDDGAPPGRFLLTGSAAPTEAPVHTGAGRIVTARMRPLSLAERGLEQATVGLAELLTGDRPAVDGTSRTRLDDYVAEIVSSGLPGIRPLSRTLQVDQLDAYLDHALRHEVAHQGTAVRRADALRRWLAAYAAATSTSASYNAILDAATAGEPDKPARSTVEGYRNALAQLWLLDPLPGWLPRQNALERLTQSPKHHLADPALAARVLGLSADLLLGRRRPRGGTRSPTALLGPLFESLVTLSIRVYAEANRARSYHLRSAGGRHEIDVVVERDDGAILPIEIKLSATVSDADVRHLRWLGQELGDRVLDAVVITTGARAFRRPDGVAVVPAALLGA
ncbi:MAG: ATP-binding protein [Phycicoccus sp.]